MKLIVKEDMAYIDDKSLNKAYKKFKMKEHSQINTNKMFCII